jgi:hypothetical protein
MPEGYRESAALRAALRPLLVGALCVACSPKAGDGAAGSTIDGSGGASARVPDASLSGSGSVTGGAGSGGSFEKDATGPSLTLSDAAAPPPDAPLAADAGCEAVKDARAQAPNVLIVLDRSRSMYVPPVDRWTPAVSAITNLTQGLDARVRFGLMEFPSPLVLTSAKICAPGEVLVPPDLHTAGAIATELAGDPTTKVGGATPTAVALDGAKTALAALPGTSYVLLVTDGAPNCNAALDSQTCTCTSARAADCTGAATVDGGLTGRKTPELCLDDDATVAAITSLASAGIHTFVIGYDTTDFASTLDRMAAAGATASTTYFPVSDGAGLASAFQSISAYVVSCTYELATPPKDARYVSVSVDGKRVARGAGWQLQGDRVVALVGDTCARVSDGKPHDILVVRECTPVLQ